MALWDEVKSRHSVALLIQLTNPDLVITSGTTVTDAVGVLAAGDVVGDFALFANVPFDSTDARHLSLAVEAVVMKLEHRRGVPPDTKRSELLAWETKLKQLAHVRSISHTRSAANSPYRPSHPHSRDGTPPRAPFDRSRFDSVIPFPPEG